ncbi:MAG: universal stress protein [Burkholderiales bacterium]|nr:MAG: universal stress protein [Burkholderiales bacterium]
MTTPAQQPHLTRIAVATDFSPPAATAADRAARLAHEHGAGLSLLHVISSGWIEELRTWLGEDTQWKDRLTAQTLDRLQAEAARLAQAGGREVAPVLLEGNPVQALATAVLEQQADLLAVGARGSNPLHHLLVGTTAERLLRKVSCPLLVVRQAATLAYRRVLVPLDFSPWSGHAVALARRVAPDAHLVLMHNFGIPFEEKLRFAGVDDATLIHYRERARAEARQRLQDFVLENRLAEHAYSLSLTEGDAPQHILTQASGRGCDLIVIGKHGRQAAEELLLGSVTKHVVAEAGCDVLVSTAHAG